MMSECHSSQQAVQSTGGFMYDTALGDHYKKFEKVDNCRCGYISLHMRWALIFCDTPGQGEQASG